ncbi:potassium channel family protein [Sphaerochaeta globosa]|uniref:TrkA-N domain protein n=1 Tax=Sphaerochaeta globosa (strain ATCC BAA-1886 / DSM 22777 / Buddy) TaxID=158189 RepID=F0RRX2_SPHGB|nr:TrkA family potassium uptake protein [Sphaerochaeta globosa]ADY14577.1 TrkA-N domain protein [Sphaerochaeta globosa str. Buddy]
MKKEFDPNAFGIIGLGRFGLALALELTKAGKQVIVLEIEAEKLDAIKDQIENIYPIKTITAEVLEESGISHCHTVIVCIGKDIESNILVTMSLVELGIPRVIAKATSTNHGKVLERIGAEAVFPEVEMGTRLAHSLVSTGTLDFLELCEDFSIANIILSTTFANQNVAQVNLRKRFHLNIIVVIRNDKAISEIGPELVLLEGDVLVVGGSNEAIKKFERANEL